MGFARTGPRRSVRGLGRARAGLVGRAGGWESQRSTGRGAGVGRAQDRGARRAGGAVVVGAIGSTVTVGRPTAAPATPACACAWAARSDRSRSGARGPGVVAAARFTAAPDLSRAPGGGRARSRSASPPGSAADATALGGACRAATA